MHRCHGHRGFRVQVHWWGRLRAVSRAAPVAFAPLCCRGPTLSDGRLAGEAGVMSLNRRKSIAPELLLAGTVNDDDKEKENLRAHNGTGTPTAPASTTFTPFKKMEEVK